MGFDAIEYPIALKALEDDLQSIEKKDIGILLKKHCKAKNKYFFIEKS